MIYEVDLSGSELRSLPSPLASVSQRRKKALGSYHFE